MVSRLYNCMAYDDLQGSYIVAMLFESAILRHLMLTSLCVFKGSACSCNHLSHYTISYQLDTYTIYALFSAWT